MCVCVYNARGTWLWNTSLLGQKGMVTWHDALCQGCNICAGLGENSAPVYIRSLVSVKAELLCSDRIVTLMTEIEHFR